jgi:hypothetical protein
MPSPSVPLPQAPVSEWNVINTNSATGLFAYRHCQATALLDFPDFGGGDMTADQRRKALSNAVNFQKPLAALAIFLGVVALEDLVRDFGARMADNKHISPHFPNLSKFRSEPKIRTPDQNFRRLDTDPVRSVEPEEVNQLLERALSIRPIPVSEYPRLRDLALIRHTVAHHAAVIRKVDVPRFQYYIVKPNQSINPPVDFVHETLTYLYRTGRTIEEAIVHRVFAIVLPTLGPIWWEKPPQSLRELIEFFNYFGFIETANGPVGYAEPGTPESERMKKEEIRIKEKLFDRCIEELRKNHVASS